MTDVKNILRYDQLHEVNVQWEGSSDPETDKLFRDLVSVESAVHQSMVIIGPWFETRVSRLIRSWLPSGWATSGPAQVFDPARPGLRSRSWDIVVHREGLTGLPPEACPGSGYALLPKSAVAVVVDTKTHYSTPKAYAAKPLFNLMNDAVEPQFDLLGDGIRKILFTARSNRSPAALSREGNEVGLEVFCLAQMKSGPVSDGLARVSRCILHGGASHERALDAFRASILEAINLQTI
jgi:hypothetical protein